MVKKKKIFDKELIKFKVFGKKISLGTPRKWEVVLLTFYFIFFFIGNQAQNKFLDNGLDYEVIVLSLPDSLGGTISALAIDIWIIFIIIFHIILLALFLMSLKSKKTHRLFDSIFGGTALFGVAILFAGVYNQINSDIIYFLFRAFKSISFYHIGVYIEIIYGVYLAFTR